MKHPLTGPRIYAVLIVCAAGFVSSKFFSKPVELDAANASASPDNQSPVRANSFQLSLASSGFSTDIGRLSPGAAAAQLTADDQPRAFALPSWAWQQSDLDQLIQSGPALPTSPTEDVQLEPLTTWTNNPSESTDSVIGSSVTPAHENMTSQATVLTSLATGNDSTLEQVEPGELVKPAAQVPTIAQYRSSPWEANEGFQQSLDSWYVPGTAPTGQTLTASSTPIRWPDEQIAADQINRIESLAFEPERAPATEANLVGSTQHQPSENYQPQIPTDASDNTPGNRFLFQPGIRPRP